MTRPLVWPPALDAIIRAHYPLAGASTALCAALRWPRGKVIQRARQLGLAPSARPRRPLTARQALGAENCPAPEYAQRARLVEPDRDERRRSRARQLAQDVSEEGACPMLLVRRGWTEGAVADLLARCPEWFTLAGGRVVMTEAGRAELTPPKQRPTTRGARKVYDGVPGRGVVG